MRLLLRLSTLVLLLAIIQGCKPPAPGFTLTGEWQLKAYKYVIEGTEFHEPDHIARPIWVYFSDRGRRGDFFGETVTNNITGRYRLAEDHSLEVFDVDGTLYGEPKWGDLFWPAMEAASGYEVRQDQLIIHYEGGGRQMIFSKR